MTRYFRYSADSLVPLNHNYRHTFAQSYALNIYATNAIFSFIPKNACSTMRLSIALANGCLKKTEDFNWIHKNNHTFSASLAELAKASYAFVILRDPFARLVSVYLDKFVNRDQPAWAFIDLNDRKIDMADVTFEVFVQKLVIPRVKNGDIHWRPQVDFLVYEEYDDYFSVEQFERAVKTLRDKIALEVVDARPLTGHHTSGYQDLAITNPYKQSPAELYNHKHKGFLPAPASMFSDEMIDIVLDAYANDLQLYREKMGAQIDASLQAQLIARRS